MKSLSRWAVLLAVLPTLALSQTRIVPERTLTVPPTVSPEMQALIAAPPSKPVAPTTDDEWRTRRSVIAANRVKELPALQERLGVYVEATTIAGVNCYRVTPRNLPKQNENRLLIHFHGGYYVFNSGEAATREAVLMAGFGQMKVLSVDYRMPPDYPYPAGLDDALAVWKAVVQSNKPENIAVLGTSAGGGMALALMLRAKKEALPLAAAMALGSPASDLTGSGDSYVTNENVDNAIVSYRPVGEAAAKLYANGHDLKEPLVSPIYGDFSGLPPAIVLSGTRDLQLSDAVNVHRKLLRAGGIAELHVFEGQSHAQFASDPSAPETREAYAQIAAFFDRYLRR